MEELKKYLTDNLILEPLLESIDMTWEDYEVFMNKQLIILKNLEAIEDEAAFQNSRQQLLNDAVYDNDATGTESIPQISLEPEG